MVIPNVPGRARTVVFCMPTFPRPVVALYVNGIRR